MTAGGPGAPVAPSRQGPFDAYLTSSGFEEALADELGAAATSGLPRWPALVTALVRSGPVDPVLARQRLPAAVLVKGESVQALIDAAWPAIDTMAKTEPGPFTIQAFVPDPQRYRTIASRASLLGESLAQTFAQRRRRRFQDCLTPEQALAHWPEVAVLQASLVGRTSLLVSFARPSSLPRGGTDLVPWPAGIAPVAEDKRAPSRAYRKLEEAFAWLGISPAAGESCVDLGGAPGGWAFAVLRRGARVVSVDRAPLLPPAAGHPALTALIGDALSYQPPAPVDWLLCDVICEPERTVALVERWMTQRSCRFLVATLKLKGRARYDALPAWSQHLAGLGWRHTRVKHLFFNHNEAMILGRQS